MATNIQYKSTDYMISGWVTPEVKVAEGFDSVGRHHPAPFLPLLRLNQEQNINVVISRGTPVAFCEGWLVPAGYKLELDAVKAGGTATIKYTAEDVRAGVKNFAGALVTKDEGVVTSIIAATKDVSFFVGIANYDMFEYQGGEGWNPTKFKTYNFNPQHAVSYKMDYHFEYPVVATAAQYEAAPLPGVAAFLGKGLKAGQFVTYDKDSLFVVADADFDHGATPKEAIVGQISQVFTYRDPDTLAVTKTVNKLDEVVTPQNTSGNKLNDLPNVRNGGMPQKIGYANAYGIVRFGLQTR